jgi:hypothetical protein
MAILKQAKRAKKTLDVVNTTAIINTTLKNLFLILLNLSVWFIVYFKYVYMQITLSSILLLLLGTLVVFVSMVFIGRSQRVVHTNFDVADSYTKHVLYVTLAYILVALLFFVLNK